jgi:hypothetical protein
MTYINIALSVQEKMNFIIIIFNKQLALSANNNLKHYLLTVF